MKFLKIGDPNLKKVSKEVPTYQISSSQIIKTIKHMKKIVLGEQKDSQKPSMVGLAAPQIGILKRIILVDIKADGKGKVGDLRVYINPKIIWTSKRKGQWYEGCYSIPEVCGIVKRSVFIKVKAFMMQPGRLQAKVVEEKYTGYLARIFQHEIDHLDGKFFVNLINNPDHLHHVKPKEFPLYRDKMAWKKWPKKYPLPSIFSRLKKV